MKSIKNILRLSEDENELVLNAKDKYGKKFETTLCFLELLDERILTPGSLDIAAVFYCQFSNNFIQCVFACLRRHSTQCHVMLRQAIESIILFHFAIHNPSKEIYGEFDEHGYYKFNGQKTSLKAFKLLSSKYSFYSSRLKEYKDAINTTFSHVNIFSAELNSTLHDDKLRLSYFDTYVEEYIEEVLLIINEIMCTSLEFLMLLSKDSRLFEFQDNITKTFIDAQKKHNDQVQDYWNSERGQQYRNDNRFEWMEKKANNSKLSNFVKIEIPKDYIFEEIFISCNAMDYVANKYHMSRKIVSTEIKNLKSEHGITIQILKRVRQLFHNKKKNPNFIFPDFYGFFKWYIHQYNEQKGCCYYCGISEEILLNLYDKNILTSKRSKNRGRHLEVDRKDSKGKYKEDNCVLSCYFCNNDKSDIFSENDYLEYLEDRKLFFENKYRNIKSN